MNFNKKEWLDRQVEFPDRRIVTDTTSGESFTADIVRDEGEIIESGDLIDAFNLNDLEDRIERAVNSKSTVTVTPTVTEGTKIADITVNSTTTSLFASGGGGGTGAAENAILDISSEVVNNLDDPEYYYHFVYLERSYYSEEVDPEEETYSDFHTYNQISDPWSPIWLIVTTYSESDHWEVTCGERETSEFQILLTGSGIMENKFIYLPGCCRFRIYHSPENPPLIKSPAASALAVGS